ncbi:signal peptidase I [Cricetibacter osteomyelitidis]|uniref:Signal peptidase I n=1 Tax=Cricetibacter osteomyelitidis TaxID=1521931 RepID=A0A4R2SMN8_9PAST|nr:signal peptidase I [Cricetibacter osteomyelitidis]TCP91309.1 signal peptidase I [Cricetibacter osteomyelitidis]
MSKFFLPILLVAGFMGWKLLDQMQLPNTFSILLIILTALSAIFWCYRRFVALPKQQRQIARLEQRSGRSLTDDEKANVEPVSEGTEFIASLFPVLAFVLVLRSFIWEPFQIPSGSMEPTLRVGDFLIVEKYAYGIKDPVFQNTLIKTGKPQRGDIVVFKAPPQPTVDYIKRIIGVGGDKIVYNLENQTLVVTHGKDGKPCEENCNVVVFQYSQGVSNPEFVYNGMEQIERTEIGDVTHQILNSPQPFFYPQTEWVVPEGQYFMMGDNRDNSGDSRYWGFVPEQNIVGKAAYIWLSLDKQAGEWPKGLRFDRMFTKIQ